MKNLSQIIEFIKSARKVHKDREIAQLLGILPKTLAAAKVRNNIPYKELITFATANDISLDVLLKDENNLTLMPSLEKVINDAAAKLPDGWTIEISIARGSEGIRLEGPNGNGVPFDGTKTLAYAIQKAAERALKI